MSVIESVDSISFESFISLQVEDLLADVRPTRENNANMRTVVRKVVDALQALGPADIIKGGSYAKGTQLRGHDKIVFVVLFTELDAALKTRKLDAMKKALRYMVQDLTVAESALSFVVDNVAFNVLLGEFLDEDDCLQAMEVGYLAGDGKDAMSQNVSAVSFELDFIKHQDVRYKDLVRYCKVWRSVWEWPDDSKPTSYLLELMCLYAYQRFDKAPSVQGAFDAFLSLCQEETFRVAWSRWYDAEDALQQECHASHSRVLLNPANPKENLVRRIAKWEVVSSRAAETQGALRAMKGPVEIVFKRLRQEVSSLKADLINKEANIRELESTTAGLERKVKALEHNLKSREVKINSLEEIRMGTVRFDVSSAILPKCGTPLQSPCFSIAGRPGMQFVFYPKGKNYGAQKCSLYLHAHAGMHIKFSLLVDDKESDDVKTLTHSYTNYDKWGMPIIDIQDSYKSIEAHIFQVAFVTPNSNLATSFETTSDGVSTIRVTWNASELRPLTKGCFHESKHFMAFGVEMTLKFYPNGDSLAQCDQSTLFLNYVLGTRIKASTFVNDVTLGPRTRQGATSAVGWDFPAQQHYREVGCIIYFAESPTSTKSDIFIYNG